MPTQEQKDNMEVPPSQSLPSPKEDVKVAGNLNKLAEQPKRDEHGVKKDDSGSSLPADAKVTANNPAGVKALISRFPTAPTKPAPLPNPAPKTSATNPITIPGGKIGVVSCETENDRNSGLVLNLKRNDGITLSLSLNFLCKQDLYACQNMFNLLGKMINLPKDGLQESFRSFVKE